MVETKKIDSYRIISKLGEGAFTEVFEAVGPQGKVALKIAREGATDEEKLLLREEFAALSSLNHPHIVSVYDFGTAEDGRPFFTMELLEGCHFNRAFKRPSRPFFIALSQILSALHYIHYLGLVHGDLKPQNIIVLRKGKSVTAKLTDFGMVQSLGVTAAQVPRGTPGYMAPEIFTGMNPDARSDLYSLGVVAYETLSGRSVFEGGQSHVLLKDKLTVELRPLSELAKSIPQPLERILERMTRVSPENRPRDALEVLDALKEFVSEESVPEVMMTQRPLLSSSLVGRTKQLDRVLNIFRKISRPKNAAVLITGPPGIGKSRLLREIKSRAQIEGAHIFAVSCIKSETQLPAEFLKIIRQGQQTFQAEASPLREEVASRESLVSQFETIGNHFSSLSEELDRKLVILIDDLDQSDRNAELLFEYLSKYCRTRHGLACIASSKHNPWADVPGEGFGIQHVDLLPLSEATTRKLVSNMLGMDAPLELARWIHGYSGGLPLLVEATTLWLHRHSLIVLGRRCEVKWNEIRKTRAPKTIDALSRLMVKDLEDEELQLLTKASAIGGTFDAQILTALSDEGADAAGATLRALRSRNLVQQEEGGKYSFTHKWLSATLYSGIDEKEKKSVHRSILKALESLWPDDHYELARHAERSGIKSKTVDYSLAAGEDAMLMRSFDSAVRFLNLALANLGDKDARRNRVMERLADAQTWNGEDAAALANYLSLSSRMREPDAKARVCRKAAFNNYYLGHTEASATLLDEARKVTQSSRSEERAKVLWLSGWIEHQAGNAKKAKGYFADALELASSLENDELMARVHAGLGRMELDGGNVTAARELSLRAISAAEECLNDVLLSAALHLLASCDIAGEKFASAAAGFRRALELDRKTGYMSGEGSSLINLAIAEQRLGELEQAREHSEEAIEICLKLQNEANAAAAENNLGYFYETTGNWKRALKYYGSALQRYGGLRDEKAMGICHLNIGLLEALSGEADSATANLKQSLKLSESSRDWNVVAKAHEALSVALANQGSLEQALREAVHAEKVASQWELDVASPLIQQSEIYLMLNDKKTATDTYEKIGSAGETDSSTNASKLRLKAELFPEQAEADIAESISIFTKLVDRFELAKTFLVQARLFANGKLPAAGGQPANAAVAAAEKALDIFRSLGAEPCVSITTRYIAEYKKRSRESARAGNVYLETIFAVNKMVDLLANERDMLDHVLDMVIDILGAERGMVLLLDQEGDLHPAAGRNIDRQSEKDITQISVTVVRSVAASGRPATSANASHDSRYMGLPSVILHGIKSLMCVPLVNRGEPVGALYVDHTLAENAFTRYDDEFLMTVGNLIAVAIDKSRYIAGLEMQNVELKRALQETFSSRNIVGKSPRMLEVIRLIGRAASTDRNVLVVGEKGTGKSIVAKALHYESQRRSGPFVVIDTTYISPGLIEDALLGHVRGAFSSAYYDSPGLIETADGGTVFLDNVDTIPLPIQAKLVAPLNSHSVRRLGAAATRTVDFRIVSASCVPLGSLVEKGLFRMDLYLTLRVLEITLPGLAERGADIFDLATHFLKRFAQRAGKPVRGFSKEALDALASQSWPGNVAELEKRIERAVVLCAGETISLKEIQSDYLEGAKTSPALESSKDFAELSEVSSAMVQSAGNVTHAAKHLGISRRQLHRLLNKHDLSPGQFKGGTGKRTTHPGDSTPGD